MIRVLAYAVAGQVTINSPTGKQLSESAAGNRWLFTGREWLPEIGLFDYRNRVYSAELGRFLQTDRIRFAANDINIYRYCSNNGLRYSDPSGDLGWTEYIATSVGAVLGLMMEATVPEVAVVAIGELGVTYALESTKDAAEDYLVGMQTGLADAMINSIQVNDLQAQNTPYDPMSLQLSIPYPDGSVSTTTYFSDGSQMTVNMGPIEFSE